MRVALASVVVVVVEGGCFPIDVWPSPLTGAPVQRQCGNAGALVDADGDLDSLGAPVVSESGVEADRAVVTFDPERAFDGGPSLAFAVDATRPPLLPAAGPVRLRIGQNNCFGEGCNNTWFVVDDDDNGALFFVGSTNTLDDDPRFHGPGFDDPVHARLGSDDDVCCNGADGALAVVVVDTDDGPAEFAAGDRGDVVIDGAPWFVIVGDASRSEFVQDQRCPDCAEPGLHSDTSIELVLYRVSGG